MPFQKGVSGNQAGRPKQTPEQKREREHFKKLLKASTVSALESIIHISQDRYNKDRFNACKYIIDKAYGANAAFLLDGTEETTPIVIEVVPYRADDDDSWNDVLKASPDDDDLEDSDDDWSEYDENED